MNHSLPDHLLDLLAQEERHLSLAPVAFFKAWKRGVELSGTQWFGNGSREALELAQSPWDLCPDLARIKRGLGVLSSGEKIFLAAMVSFYNAHEGGSMLKRCHVEGLADLGGLDLQRRKVIVELLLHYSGW
ncbi:hypothetical protein [Pseudomonas sp. NBRC 100443]|uniref:hypothetical protein n=1 Tax=Pseudomonas sp. NBRC 100443 TaxID=1113665 RepID=UPI0024A5818D|nr:hypothetical protein [Pseudomonas sp. NBRC 100443]GLU39179.1 hypothetical protein Pssp01_32720 [Pseudomonas sp. NBRC 100443]